MREVKVRSDFTSRGYIGFGSWNHDTYTYSLAQIYLGNNPLSKIEVVSGLNFSNYAVQSWFYSDAYSYSKYNPKLYLGTIQTVASSWLQDDQNDRKNLPNLPLGGVKKVAVDSDYTKKDKVKWLYKIDF